MRARPGRAELRCYTAGMRRVPRAIVVCVALAAAAAADVSGSADTHAAQTRRSRRRPAPPPAPPTIEPAAVACPNVLGRGVRTRLIYCDIATGRNPADGIRVKIPPHTGAATILFTLHNRHLYSEELMRAGKVFVRYTATIGALAPDGTLITRAMVQSEFRSAKDLVDRIEGGPGLPVKAVAPIGAEAIVIEVPANVAEVSLLGEKLEALKIEGRETYTSPGQLVASASDFKVEYRPAPKPPAKGKK
jgi:hypothetical protein